MSSVPNSVDERPPRRRDPEDGGSFRLAALWSYSLIWGRLAITTILAFVLAALLGPEAYGVIAMALVFTGFVEMLQQQGMMPAIIAHRALDDDHKDTAFWLVIGVGVVLSASAILAAPWWASVNHLPELTPVIRVLALGVPLTSSVVVHEAVLRRTMQFKRLAAATWTAVIAGGLVGLSGALLGWGVWALVAQQLAMVVTTVCVLWWISSWRPRLNFRLQAARDLWHYSVRSSTSSLAMFFGGRMDVILGGALFGPVAIGVYRMAQRLTEVVLDVTFRGMQSVSLPGLAQVQDARVVRNTRFLTMQRRAVCLALPLLGIVAATAPVVQDLLGDEWTGTATAIRLLVIVQALRAMTGLMGPALQAVNRPGTLAILQVVLAGAGATAIVVASRVSESTDAVATLSMAVISATVVTSILVAHVTGRILEIRWRDILRSWAPGLLAGLAATTASYASFHALASTAPLVATFVAGTVGLVSGGVVVLAADPALRQVVVGRLRPHTSG